MNKKPKRFFILIIGLLLTLSSAPGWLQRVSAQSPVVNAILFYSPSCPHCQTVITEELPPLIEKYGSQLNVIGINVSIQKGQELYQSAVERYQIPDDKLGVPCLIVGDTVLVGALEIPEQFPGIIEKGLTQGGISLPDIPGLKDALVESPISSQTTESDQITQSSPAEHPAAKMTLLERFSSDLTGNAISVITLLGMVGSVIGVGIRYWRDESSSLGAWPDWAIPLLAVIGVGISVYMSYVEITQTEAICGPVGNCNAVQQSQYARLFGVLPVGVLGIIGYMLVGVSWLLRMLVPERWRNALAIILWGIALGGVLFSIYLTFLEPFVIGATCAWCISSAIVMTLIFLAASEPARLAWKGISNPTFSRKKV